MIFFNFGWLFMCYPDPYQFCFMVSWSGSGSGQMIWIRPDPGSTTMQPSNFPLIESRGQIEFSLWLELLGTLLSTFASQSLLYLYYGSKQILSNLFFLLHLSTEFWIRIWLDPYHLARSGSGSTSGNVDPDPGSKKNCDILT